jgi:hypothetical protein
MRPDKRRFAGEIAGNVFCRHFSYISTYAVYISQEKIGARELSNLQTSMSSPSNDYSNSKTCFSCSRALLVRTLP